MHDNFEHQTHHIKGYNAFEHRPAEHHILVEHGIDNGLAFDHTRILHSAFLQPFCHAHSLQDEALPILLFGDTGCQPRW